MRRLRRWLYPKVCGVIGHRWWSYDKARNDQWVLVVKVCLRCTHYEFGEDER